MPFTKTPDGKYVSPAGNKFTRKQVALYYAKGGRFPGQAMRETFPQKNLEMPYGKKPKTYPSE
jgi:hypothetical protein